VYAAHDFTGDLEYRKVTIVARDNDRVVFYEATDDENFQFGVLTNETDRSGDRIIQVCDADGSELSALQRALDKEWNP
jgi:hypothetical protein